MLRAIVAMNARGQVIHEQRGNAGINTFRSYAAETGWLNQINSYVPYRPSGSLQNLQYSYDLLGNVTARSDTTSGANRAETFSYDRLQFGNPRFNTEYNVSYGAVISSGVEK